MILENWMEIVVAENHVEAPATLNILRQGMTGSYVRSTCDDTNGLAVSWPYEEFLPRAFKSLYQISFCMFSTTVVSGGGNEPYYVWI